MRVSAHDAGRVGASGQERQRLDARARSPAGAAVRATTDPGQHGSALDRVSGTAMEAEEKRGPMDRPWLFGVPVWAWLAGLAMGLVFGLLVFDDRIVGVMFAVSIGTAFALAFGETAKKKK